MKLREVALNVFDGHALELKNPERNPDLPSTLTLNQNFPIEVMRDFDMVLFFGKLSQSGLAELVIERIPGEDPFPHIDRGDIVLVRAYDAEENPVLLRAQIIQASMVKCTVGRLELIPYQTQRKSVRYPLHPPADIYLLDDTALSQPQPCQLLNLSTSGACVISEHSYVLQQTLRLRVELNLNDRYTFYRCQVVRMAPRSGGRSEYGLSFVQLGSSEFDSLMLDIQTIQQAAEQKCGMMNER